MYGYRPPVNAADQTRVLVIDDEAPIRLLCRVNLEAEGIHVLEAADGTTGLDLARAEQPDVVLLDVMMPGLDGWRVAEELLEDDRTRGIPIIFLTARAAFRDHPRFSRVVSWVGARASSRIGRRSSALCPTRRRSGRG